MNKLSNKIVIVAVALLLIMAFIIFFISFSARPKPDEIQPSPSLPTPEITKIIPPFIKDAPTVRPDQGFGIDKNSPIIQNSMSEIEKISPELPFSVDFTSSTNIDVSILIPRQSLQTNAWTLKAQVFGINYNTSPEQSDYESMKRSFIEASNIVFAWVRESGGDPEKTIFVWGDKKFIQAQAEKWLQEPN